ncbi:MAG: zinc carboxypeptidase [Candidatus Wallbacteria bacterium]|nr:zinc carboxypeptidase [Candidatus Wallbacteria bacterium]
MSHLRPLLGWSLSLLLLAPALQAATSPQLLRVYFHDRKDVRALAKSGADIVRHGDHWLEVVVPGDDEVSTQSTIHIQRILSRFDKQEVLVKNLDSLLDQFQGRPDLGVYHTVKEAHDELAAYAKQYPQICRVESIGKTFEGRDIEALVVGPQGAKAAGKPKFMFCGAHHSREWISVEVPMTLAKKLVTGYATDPATKALVDSRITWIIPVLNPDGTNYSQTASKMWRKNRRKNSDGSFGVDPNRNYGYQWGGLGASTYPDSDTYRGEAGFSEPETAAIRDLARREHFAADISFHSYSELVFWPWSYSDDHIDAAHETLYKKFATDMAAINGYTAEKSSDLYASSGDFDDFMFGDTKACSFTIELAQTFVPAESEVPDICEKNSNVCLWVMKNLEDAFPRMAHTPPASGTADGFNVQVTLNKDLYPDDNASSVSAVYSTADGSIASTELPAVAGQKAAFSGMIPAKAKAYHFEYKASDGQTVRWPPYRDFDAPASPQQRVAR